MAEDPGSQIPELARLFPLLVQRIGTRKAIYCAWMAGKEEFSAGVVKALKRFFKMFSVPGGGSGRAVGS